MCKEWCVWNYIRDAYEIDYQCFNSKHRGVKLVWMSGVMCIICQLAVVLGEIRGRGGTVQYVNGFRREVFNRLKWLNGREEDIQWLHPLCDYKQRSAPPPSKWVGIWFHSDNNVHLIVQLAHEAAALKVYLLE